MSQTLYLECHTGISGDMMVAALLDLGADEEVLKKAIGSLPLKGYQIRIGRVKKAGLDAADFAVLLDPEHENRDHDMAYLHGSGQEEHSRLRESHTHGKPHHHGESHIHSHGPHGHRGLPEILEMIKGGDLTEHAKELAGRIFDVLAEAEAKAHGVLKEQVHFHEVGAVDSIIDIVAAAVCLDNLGITQVIIPRLCEGRGSVRCQHGVLPVPVPAVVNIVSSYNLKLHIMEEEGEFVTPTGAAIAAAIQTRDQLPNAFLIMKTGLGAGKREYKRPSLLRAMLIEEAGDGHREEEKEGEIQKAADIYKLESNIDDCTSEALGYVMNRLFEEGARDVHFIPVYMKKNRPAYQINIICEEAFVPKMEQILFEETTTIGIRKWKVERAVLERKSATVNTLYGQAKVKLCRLPSEIRYYPEYESVAKLSRESNIPYHKMYQAVLAQCPAEEIKEGNYGKL